MGQGQARPENQLCHLRTRLLFKWPRVQGGGQQRGGWPSSWASTARRKPQFTVYSDYDCYLTLINVDKHGETTVIYPNKFEQNNFITGGKEFHYPAADAAYDFKYLDKGVEKVVAICDTKGDATAAISHNFEAEEFTSLGKEEVATRKIDVIKRPKTVKAKKGKAVYTGVAQAAIKITVQ